MGSSHASPLGRSAPPPEAPHHRRVSRWRTGSRREVLALNVLAASLTSLTPLLPALARTTPLLGDSADRPPAVVMRLYRCNGAFCTYYTVDDQRFRAVVDTGSPFLMVDGRCGPPRRRTSVLLGLGFGLPGSPGPPAVRLLFAWFAWFTWL